MLRMFASLSASASICSSRSARPRPSSVARLRASQGSDLSSESLCTSFSTRAPNRSSSSASATPASSSVSCSSPAAMRSSSAPICARISATSNGCVIYGICVPFLHWPSCAAMANRTASATIRFCPPSFPRSAHPYRPAANAVSSAKLPRRNGAMSMLYSFSR